MASKYFTASILELFDGDVALANDVNAVSNATEAGFDTVLQDFASITVDINTAVVYSTEWANKAEDVLISVAAGGDGIDDYSSLHHATKAAANAVLTAADVVLTHADVVLTHADEALTNADALATAADKVATNADVVLTHADVVLTHADEALTNADALATAADKIATNADAAATALDKIATNADVVLTHADVVLTHADEALTNADALATAADKVATNADAAQTALDAAATAADKVATNADVVLTNADVVTVAGIYDDFDDRYLGSKAIDPTLDNDGNALLTGALYFSTSLNAMKVYNGVSWDALGSGGATGGGADDVFHENSTNVTTDYTITTGKNAISAGPITIDTGATVTVPTGSVWTIV